MSVDPSVAAGLTLETAVALLVIKEVFAFIKWWGSGEKKDKQNEEIINTRKDVYKVKESVEKIQEVVFKISHDIDQMHTQNNEMYDWHNKSDPEGVKIWYVRRSLEIAIQQLSENISIQTDVLKEIIQEQRENKKDMERLMRQVEVMVKPNDNAIAISAADKIADIIAGKIETNKRSIIKERI